MPEWDFEEGVWLGWPRWVQRETVWGRGSPRLDVAEQVPDLLAARVAGQTRVVVDHPELRPQALAVVTEPDAGQRRGEGVVQRNGSIGHRWPMVHHVREAAQQGKRVVLSCILPLADLSLGVRDGGV